MPNRRTFLAGAAALAIVPSASWADAGGPQYLAAARVSDGTYGLFGLDDRLKVVFSLPLPGRGHAAAAHPKRPEAVAFARRPGTYALVIDCKQGHRIATLAAPAARHFYGHGVFSADGSRLFTTENAYEVGQGVIGVWAADDGYKRIGEFPSGGIGPHDILRLPGSDRLVVANGGIDTHPDTGREKLNLPTMRSNISFLSGDGQVLARKETSQEAQQNSIRHLAVRPDGLVAFGCQWQGDAYATPSLVGTCRIGSELNMRASSQWADQALDGYIGSIAFSGDGNTIVVTAPRGNRVILFDARSDIPSQCQYFEDVCGVASGTIGFAITSGTGALAVSEVPEYAAREPVSWDNHLVRI